MPVVVANDSHAAALAELTFHRRPRPTNLIVIRVGRGIGAGIILNGQLFQGDGTAPASSATSRWPAPPLRATAAGTAASRP